MAEGYLRHFAGNRAGVYSAGTEPQPLNTRAIAVMQEDGIDISQQRSKAVDEFLNAQFDFVITVCDHARETCPVFTNQVTDLHQGFADPSLAQGTEEEIMTAFRTTRDAIRDYCRQFVQERIGI
jgi:arsenate reductase